MKRNQHMKQAHPYWARTCKSSSSVVGRKKKKDFFSLLEIKYLCLNNSWNTMAEGDLYCSEMCSYTEPENNQS